MKVAVFGPGIHKRQTYGNYDYVATRLAPLVEPLEITEIHTGGGKGVEQLALRFATLNGIEPVVTPPNIGRDGDNAFVIRNREILEKVDFVVLLWDAVDPKYEKMLKDCARRNLPILTYGVE